MPSGEDLVSQETLIAAVSGDTEAVAALWRAWNPPLLRFLIARRVPDSDDLASVIWLDIATRMHLFNGDPAAFRRWLFTVAHRRIIDDARKRGRQVATTALENAGQLNAGVDNYAAVGSTDWALAMLRQLNDNQATAIALRVLADMSVAQVAEIMGQSPSSVRVLTHRGLASLRELLVASLGDTIQDPVQEITKNTEKPVTLSMFRSLTPDA